MDITTVDTNALAHLIARIHLDKTGQKNCLGSVESTLKELMPSVLEGLEQVSQLGEKA